MLKSAWRAYLRENKFTYTLGEQPMSLRDWKVVEEREEEGRSECFTEDTRYSFVLSAPPNRGIHYATCPRSNSHNREM